MRKTFVVIAAIIIFFSPLMCAQDPLKQPSPAMPAEILGPPLVAWSVLQKPHPIPASDSRVDPSQVNQSQSEQPSQAGQTAESQPQPPSAQTFTGTITKDSDKYVLKVSENVAYQFDDQEKARSYEGKQVKIAASLDAKNNVLHVTSIELIA